MELTTKVDNFNDMIHKRQQVQLSIGFSETFLNLRDSVG